MGRRFPHVAYALIVLAGLCWTADAQTDANHVVLKGFGIEFTAPQSWSRTKETSYSELARFGLIRGNTAAGFIQITAGAAHGRSAAEMANQMAATTKGKVLPAANAKNSMIEVELPASESFPENRAGVVPAGARLVVIQVGAKDPGAAAVALKAINESITLTDPKPASATLELPARHEVQLSNSAVLMPLPEAFRPDNSRQSPSQAFYGARDWTTGKDEASIIVQSVPNTEHVAIATFIPIQEAALTTRLKLAEPLKFKKVADKPEVYLSNVFSTTADESQRIICTSPDPEHIALIMSRSTATTPAAREAYMKIVDEMSQHLRVSEAYKQAVDAAKPPAKP